MNSKKRLAIVPAARAEHAGGPEIFQSWGDDGDHGWYSRADGR